MIERANHNGPKGSHSGADLLDRYIADDEHETHYGQGGLIDMAMIRGVLYRQRWIVALSIILSLLAGVIITLMQTPIYEAQASVRVDPQGNYILEGQDLAPGINVHEYGRYVETLGAVVMSQKMAETVAEELQLAEREGFLPAEFEETRPPNISDARWQAEREKAAARLAREGVDVDVPFADRIMTISYRSVDPGIAASLANGYAQAFLREDTKRSIDANNYAMEYLSQQIAEIRAKLQDAELATNAYARENQLVGSTPIASSDGEGSTTTITNETLSSVNASFTQARAARIAAEQRWNAVSGAPAPLYPLIVQLLFAEEFLAGVPTIAWFLTGESLRISGALLLFTFMSRALGMYTLLPRIGALAVAIAFVHWADELTLVTLAQAYAAAFATYYAIAMILWLGLQLRMAR